MAGAAPRWPHIRAARVRQHSPDPEYETKMEHLLACLRDAVAHPDEIELVFLDKMGYYRWPKEGAPGAKRHRHPHRWPTGMARTTQPKEPKVSRP
jgi:hypothetical protein